MKRLITILMVLLAACERNSPVEPIGLSRPQRDLTEDVTPPQIVAFTISPSQVDASASQVALTVRLQFSDDLSGIGYCAFEMRSASGSQFLADGLHLGQLVQGTTMAGVLETTVLVPRHSESGTWSMQYVYCRDAATNGIQYDVGNPPPFSAPVFTVTSAGDTEPPAIVSASIAPAVVDASGGATALTFTIQFSDNLAGIEYCAASFQSPSGLQSIGFLAHVNSDLVSGTTLTGVLATTSNLPQHSETGIWTPVYVHCRDAARNGVQYGAGNPLHPQPQFEVASAADITPPEITAVTIAPVAVDVSESSAVLTLRIAFRDALAGIDYCAAVWHSPSSGQWISWSAYPPVHLVAGTVNEGVLETTSELPQYSEAGEWRIQYVFCRDEAMNGTQYTETEPLPSGAPTFMVGETNACVLIDQLVAVSPLRSLAAKAEAARASCGRGHNSAAANQLRAYSNELDALLKTGHIDAALGAQLAQRVTRILDLLSGP